MSARGDNKVNIKDLIGVVPVEIIRYFCGEIDYDGRPLLTIRTAYDGTYKFVYFQDCCANCWLEDVDGDLQDLIGKPITLAEEVSSQGYDENPTDCPQESFTWTFYKIGNDKISITLRFYGESNGFYSEEVDLIKEER